MSKLQAWQATIVGLLLIVIGAYFLHDEMQGAIVHTKHVYTFVGLMVVGAGVIFPSFILGLLKQAFVLVPWSGKYGNRPEDVPLEKAPAGTQAGDPVPGAPAPVIVIAKPKPDPQPGDS